VGLNGFGASRISAARLYQVCQILYVCFSSMFASYVDRILRGANPGELPVQLPARFQLAINLKTAKALGLTIPNSMLLLADDVIDWQATLLNPPPLREMHRRPVLSISVSPESLGVIRKLLDRG
jgi:hypothetical protein